MEYFFSYVLGWLIVLAIVFRKQKYIEVTSKEFIITTVSYTIFYIIMNKYVNFP